MSTPEGGNAAPGADDVIADDLIAEAQTRYLAALQAGSGRLADRALDHALSVLRLPPPAIYLRIFQPTAYDIGRLWQVNRLSVAQEHLATAIIERHMGEMHPLFRPTRSRPHTLVLGCVDKELHRVGARMVADFFEADGWQVHYLGASVPAETLIGLAVEAEADLIGLSVQMAHHVPKITEVVRWRDRRGLAGLPLMAGGLPFMRQPDLWRALGVTLGGGDAAQAVAQANALMAALD